MENYVDVMSFVVVVIVVVNVSDGVAVVNLSITGLVLSLLVLLIHHFFTWMDHKFGFRGVVVRMMVSFSAPQVLLLL